MKDTKATRACPYLPARYTQTDLDRSESDAAEPAAMAVAESKTFSSTLFFHPLAVSVALAKELSFGRSLLERLGLDLRVLVRIAGTLRSSLRLRYCMLAKRIAMRLCIASRPTRVAFVRLEVLSATAKLDRVAIATAVEDAACHPRPDVAAVRDARSIKCVASFWYAVGIASGLVGVDRRVITCVRAYPPSAPASRATSGLTSRR